ncbi:MAG TPA: hypothetical protein VM658_17135 [bacterium]|nr:hypothetical protein [bacterium]
MTEQLEKWIEAWWEDQKRPETIQEKQVWTIFKPGDGTISEGSVVAIISATAHACLVVPLHEEMRARAAIEPVLTAPDLPFAADLVAAVGAAVTLSREAFSEARYLGELSPAALERVTAAHQDFLRVSEGLTELRALEAEHGPEGVPETDLQRIFSAGVLKLVPIAADPDELAAVHDELLANLKPFESAENVAGRERGHDLGLDLNPAADHYKSIIRFLDQELAGLAREEINQRAEDLNLLAALVYARTGQWDQVERSLRNLMSSEKSDLAARGISWLSQNLNHEVSGPVGAGPSSPAPELAFYDHIRVSDPDREIGRILRKLGSPIALTRKK